MRAVRAVTATLLWLTASTGVHLVEAATCEDIASWHDADARIVSAEQINPDPIWNSPPNFTTGNRPIAVTATFCRVQAVIEPEIEFELWLPPSNRWNARYLGVGNGGDAGFINYQDLARGVSRGFASASTDTGHKRADAHWGLGHPERVENFGHRAHHSMAEIAKKLIGRYYGATPSKAYFMGCSGGGMQGLSLAQRYPKDYDGIIAGAGGVGMLPLSARMLSTALALEQNPTRRLSNAQWSLIAATVIRTCDLTDGMEDGVVENPMQCSFDPKHLQCGQTDADDCLTTEQVDAVRAVTSPLGIATGPQIDPGFPAGIRYAPTVRQIDIAGTLFGDWTYQDSKWNVRTFDLDRDVSAVRRTLPYLEFLDPDLRDYRKAGGKLISYHGWLDPTVPAGLTIQFHERAVNKLGQNADDTVRLFMAPGMEHCSRGPGPDSFGQAFRGDAPIVDAEHDLLTALMAWVESDRAPTRIITSRIEDEKVVRTRPLCPYPQVATYLGSGSTDEAANFKCTRQ